MNKLNPTTFPLRGHQLIEASAGTGKTYTITNLYLRLLLGRDETLDHELAVDQILVLTFTIAATEELRGRIRTRINEARAAFAAGDSQDTFLAELMAGSEDTTRDMRLLAGAVQLMDEASIFTIHGFCARVLADNAFETGMLFDQALDADRDELLEQAVRDCFRADILQLPRFHRHAALDLWPSPDALSRATKAFLFRPSLELTPPRRDIDEQALIDRIRMLKQRWLDDDFEDVIRKAKFDGRTSVIKRLPDMTEWCRTDALDTDLWSLWSSQTLEETRLNQGGALPDHPIIGEIDTLLAEFAQIRINLWHLVIDRLRHYLERYKEEQARLTLDDLLTRVHAAQIAPGGELLSENLATRWPVALIDEFQDTDDMQWDIFSHIYRGRGQGLFLIGDPKQAIYQFRGADVFTYINAKREIDSRFSLDTNWRSRPPVIEAVNALFDQPAIFDNDDDIPFEPVHPSSRSQLLTMTEGGDETAPISLFRVPADGANKNKLRRLQMDWAAEEASRLLRGERGDVEIDGKPLHAGQIAILVRSRRDAKAAREALAERNIRSVYVTLESVFLTETAEDLRLILHAVLEPNNDAALRAAVSTRLLQSSASEIDALNNDIEAQLETMQEFRDYHQLWSDMDVATMIEALMTRRQIPQKWLARADGERQVTNLSHLTELLQKRASIAPGMHRLLKWFSREQREVNAVAAEERQLRLESDRDLVKVVTMHAAKGLEYEIVMIPMAAFTTQQRRSEPNLFHELRQGHYTEVLDLTAEPATAEQCRREQRAEDMRLLYVAITRARHKCYIGVPEVGELPRSALAQLLRLDGETGDSLHERLRTCWQPPAFEVIAAAESESTPWHPRPTSTRLDAPRQPPTIESSWRIHSYTGVTRLLQAQSTTTGSQEHPGFADDDEGGSTLPSPRFTRFAFPRGPRVGVALHTLLEDLDFTAPAGDQPAIVNQCLDRVGLTGDRDQWMAMLIEWLEDIRETPIDDFRLADIDRSRRLDEMEFHFPLATEQDVFAILQSAGYCRGHLLLPGQLRGLMTGMIDLVVEHEGRYWLADYKSNHLGNELAHYDARHLAAAIDHHLYDLQYLIYTVALDRYLAGRISDYDYESHFGGVAYLFLRGMHKDGGEGVFVDRPSPELVRELAQALRGSHAA